MTWRCSCSVLYVRFAQGTCFSTRSHGIKATSNRIEDARWDPQSGLLAGPEIVRVISEFEVGMLTRTNAVFQHHVQSPSVQQRFVAHTKPLIIAFQEAGNQFDVDSHEVVIIDTREVMPNNVARNIMSAHGERMKQHADFVAYRLQ